MGSYIVLTCIVFPSDRFHKIPEKINDKIVAQFSDITSLVGCLTTTLLHASAGVVLHVIL